VFGNPDINCIKCFGIGNNLYLAKIALHKPYSSKYSTSFCRATTLRQWFKYHPKLSGDLSNVGEIADWPLITLNSTLSRICMLRSSKFERAPSKNV